MANEPVWLDATLIVSFNEHIVAETGEPFLLREPGLLESAITRPVNRWNYGEIDIVVLATALLIGVGKNHPFIQGNKRTAFAAFTYFLYLNGYDFTFPDGDQLADLIIGAIAGEISEGYFVEAVSPYVEQS